MKSGCKLLNQYKAVQMTRDKSDKLKKAMVEALEQSLGIVTAAAKNVGISRKTHYEWLKDDKDYAAAVAALENVALDFAESKLHNLIKNGDTTATIFYLKTKGKGRGYVEPRHHILSGDENAPIAITTIKFVDGEND